MRENWRKLVRYMNNPARMLAVLAALVTFSSGQSSAQQYEFERFRNVLIDYFKRQNYEVSTASNTGAVHFMTSTGMRNTEPPFR